MFAIAAGVAVGVLATSGLSYAAVSQFTSSVHHTDVFGPLQDRPAEDAGTNILLVGSDDRSGMSEDQRLALSLGLDDFGRHTDTVMIVHVSDDGRIDVVSLPRDSKVTIPTHTDDSGTTPAHDAKLNSAFGEGGPSLLVQTIEQATDVRIDHYVEVNFAGFVDIVNALGGVDVCTPTPIQDEMSGLNIPAGTTTVDGAMGLSYVRARYFDPSADLGRMNRQQEFLASMFRKATSSGTLLNPVRISSTVDAVLASLTTDDGLTPAAVRTLMQKLQRTSPGQVTFLTMPVADTAVQLDDGGEAVTWDPQASTKLFTALQSGGSVTQQAQAAPAAPTVPTVKVPPAQVSLEVLNGSGTAGAAAKAGDDLSAAGFTIEGIGNGSPKAHTTITYDPDHADGLETVKAALPEAAVETKPGSGSTISITIGPDYTGPSTFQVAGQPSAAPSAAAAVPAAAAPEADPATPRSAADNPCTQNS